MKEPVSALETINLLSSIASLILAIVAIALAITFYWLSSKWAKVIENSSNEIRSSIVKIELIFNTFYKDTFTMMKQNVEQVWGLLSQKTLTERQLTQQGLEDKKIDMKDTVGSKYDKERLTNIILPKFQRGERLTDEEKEQLLEFYWAAIFRKQIEILKHLRERGSVKKNNLVKFYDKDFYPRFNVNLDQFFYFLTGNKFVDSDFSKDLNNPSWMLSDFGKEFLAFVESKNYNIDEKFL